MLPNPDSKTTMGAPSPTQWMCRERPPMSTIPSMMGAFAPAGLIVGGRVCEHASKLSMAGANADMNHPHSTPLHPRSRSIAAHPIPEPVARAAPRVHVGLDVCVAGATGLRLRRSRRFAARAPRTRERRRLAREPEMLEDGDEDLALGDVGHEPPPPATRAGANTSLRYTLRSRLAQAMRAPTGLVTPVPRLVRARVHRRGHRAGGSVGPVTFAGVGLVIVGQPHFDRALPPWGE